MYMFTYFQNVKNAMPVIIALSPMKLEHATNQMVNVNAHPGPLPPLPSTKLLYCSPHSWFYFHTNIVKLISTYGIQAQCSIKLFKGLKNMVIWQFYCSPHFLLSFRVNTYWKQEINLEIWHTSFAFKKLLKGTKKHSHSTIFDYPFTPILNQNENIL